MQTYKQIFHDLLSIISFNEPLGKYTSFKIGGPADVFARPQTREQLKELLKCSQKAKVKIFILGKGANILVADKGFRGLVISLECFNQFSIEDCQLKAEAGLAISDLAKLTAEQGLAGLEAFYSMPGSVGGAVWMNARCYGVEIADCLTRVVTLSQDLIVSEKKVHKNDFAYKYSPFQASKEIILQATFKLTKAFPAELERKIKQIFADRTAKGHFSYPSAGSVFKNNHEFGKPCGAIIDSLGLKGLCVGQAMVSPLHANFIVNTGQATAKNVKELMDLVAEKVFISYGLKLEPEIILVGEWL